MADDTNASKSAQKVIEDHGASAQRQAKDPAAKKADSDEQYAAAYAAHAAHQAFLDSLPDDDKPPEPARSPLPQQPRYMRLDRGRGGGWL